MNNLKIRRIENTELKKESLEKCLKIHLKKLIFPVILKFDSRLNSYGSYIFQKDHHLIKISPKKNKVQNDPEGSLFVYLSTILHEVCHAYQMEMRNDARVP